MEDFNFYNKHYLQLRADGTIIDGWSDGPHPEKDTSDAVCINEKGGYQFRLEDGGEENPPLYTWEGIPLYKYQGGKILQRGAEEIQAELDAIPAPPPSPMEQLRADVDFLLVMEDLT